MKIKGGKGNPLILIESDYEENYSMCILINSLNSHLLFQALIDAEDTAKGQKITVLITFIFIK